ncbi:lysozyme inhibitor LprI family protein [Bradyrhizobium erythrophlei]|uniref:lysozyme inhibitor LprI family protein n=1 Tax=Bradyrhizobium erythrophlei TaxID=1437360 RepID=UPI0035E672FC
MMPALPRLAAFAIAVSALTPVASFAMDDYLRAASSAPTAIKLCGEANDDRIKSADCRTAGYDKMVTQIDKAFDLALARTPANIKPLLKRDQAWFNEMILEAADTVRNVDEAEIRQAFAETLRRRVAALDGIAGGFGRPGIAGRWANAFGTIAVTPAEGGAYRLAADIRADYGSDKHRSCKFNARVQPTATSWLAGPVLADQDKADDKAKADAKVEPAKPPTLKLRRQGETLRIVAFDGDEGWDGLTDCEYMWQITGSYFATGKPDAADTADTAFVAPTFDCARPATATDEEICADPDLADNDNRLNRAWKALLPRLDEATRRALAEDQRGWVRSQTQQFPEFLHPAWDKQTSETHYTTDARYHVDSLQRERIALLEGFDDKREGLAGDWLAHNAIIRITIDGDGTLKAEGWKWDQGDWKAGCDYDMTGKVVGGTFRSAEQRKNPDTLERDHAMLIVNRQDDVFAKKRYANKDGTENKNADEEKCRRRLDISSTARLFPARPSADINNFKGSIR